MCVVMVFDGDFIDIVLLVIIINDVNDYIFIMGSFFYIFYVLFGIGVGIVIGQILVIDGDMGLFGKNNFNMYIGVYFFDIFYCFLLNIYEMIVQYMYLVLFYIFIK